MFTRANPGSFLHPPVSTRKRELPRRPQLRALGLLAPMLFGISRAVLADPIVEQAYACEVVSPSEARSLADQLFEAGEYQQAGECYEAAGDLTHADLAFLKATGPKSEDTARALKAQRLAAQSLASNVKLAFHRSR